MIDKKIETKPENNSSKLPEQSSIYIISQDKSKLESELDIDQELLIEDELRKILPLHYILFHSIVLIALSLAILFFQSKIIIYGEVNNFYIGIW